MKDIQATKEASSPQKRTTSISIMKFLQFSLLWVFFALSDSDSDPADQNQRGSMRIRIQIYNNAVILICAPISASFFLINSIPDDDFLVLDHR